MVVAAMLDIPEATTVSLWYQLPGLFTSFRLIHFFHKPFSVPVTLAAILAVVLKRPLGLVVKDASQIRM